MMQLNTAMLTAEEKKRPYKYKKKHGSTVTQVTPYDVCKREGWDKAGGVGVARGK